MTDDLTEATPTLWIPSCSRCGGAGAIRLDELGPYGKPDDWIACPKCDGSGLEDAGHPERRRLADAE